MARRNSLRTTLNHFVGLGLVERANSVTQKPTPHIPDLQKFENLKDEELQFYGLIGALISLVAGLEYRSFLAFQLANGLDEATATAQFYRKRSFPSERRRHANEAMQKYLNGEKLIRWNEIFDRWSAATDDSAPRHLLSHNQVRTIEKHVGGIFDPAIFDDAIFDTGRVELALVIKEDDFKVMANIRRAANADVADLLDNCKEVTDLLNDIDRFLLELRS